MTSRTLITSSAVLACAVVLVLPTLAYASDTGAEFSALYDFVYGAATGYLGRTVCIVGGLLGLGYGAMSGKATPALMGIVLAAFGTLGPAIINTIFASAVI